MSDHAALESAVDPTPTPTDNPPPASKDLEGVYAEIGTLKQQILGLAQALSAIIMQQVAQSPQAQAALTQQLLAGGAPGQAAGASGDQIAQLFGGVPPQQ